jgi:hypothetical protein
MKEGLQGGFCVDERAVVVTTAYKGRENERLGQQRITGYRSITQTDLSLRNPILMIRYLADEGIRAFK